MVNRDPLDRESESRIESSGRAGTSARGGSPSNRSVRQESGDSSMSSESMRDRSTGSFGEQSDTPISEKVTDAGKNVRDQVVDQVGTRADSQKDRAASGLMGFADAMRQVSEQMRQQDQGSIANVAEQAATQINQVGDYLQNKDIGQIMNGVENVARRQPLLFLGGAFALGVFAARFLKASPPEPEYDYGAQSRTGASGGYYGGSASTGRYGSGTGMNPYGTGTRTPGGRYGTQTGAGTGTGPYSTSTGSAGMTGTSRYPSSSKPTGSETGGTSSTRSSMPETRSGRDATE